MCFTHGDLRCKPAAHLVTDQRNTDLSFLGQKEKVVSILDILRDAVFVSSFAHKYHCVSCIQMLISETF